MVRTGPDGSYALPSALPLSSYHVRASALGFFAGSYTDEPAVVGYRKPKDFPPGPDHDFRLEPNHGMVAVGSSALGSNAKPFADVTAGMFSSDQSSLLFAMSGPSLWLVSLPDGKVRSIPLPSTLSSPTLAISALGWDGHELLFLAADPTGDHRVLGEAAAPEFHVSLLPTPNFYSTGITIGPAKFEPDRFLVEQTSSCDEEKDPSPHCGQTGSLVVNDEQKGSTQKLLSGAVSGLSYLLDPISHIIFWSDPVETPVTPTTRQQSPQLMHQRLAAMDLTSGGRSFVDLPGDGSATLSLIAEHVVAAKGLRLGYRTAYTTQGDCDPASVDVAQPFAPAGPAGTTPNQWSLCIVTVSVPVPKESPKSPRHVARPPL